MQELENLRNPRGPRMMRWPGLPKRYPCPMLICIKIGSFSKYRVQYTQMDQQKTLS